MAAYKGKYAALYVVAGAAVAMANEVCSANSARTIYTIAAATKRYIDPATAVVVRTSPNGSDWSIVPSTDYVINYAGGCVIFTVARAVGTQIKIDGAYLPYAKCADAKEYSVDVDASFTEQNVFGDDWKSIVPTQKSATITFGKWWIDKTFLDYITADQLIGVSCYAEPTGAHRVDALGYLTKDSIKSVFTGLIEESLTLQSDGRISIQ